MYNLTDVAVIRRLMGDNQSGFKKSLGQNFIIDGEICPEMVRFAGIDEECGVLEIGPGIGVLTQELAQNAKRVVCFEADKRLKAILDKTLADFDNVEIIFEDFLKCDLQEIFENCFADVSRVMVAANLPYYITSPILMKLLEENPGFESITLMVQKEAGVRLCAPIGTRDSGAVSVAAERYAKRKILFDVDRECFFPSPNVDSCVIKLDLRKDEEKYGIDNLDLFNKIVKSGFGKRRKTILNCLSSDLNIPKEKLGEALEKSGLDNNARLEALNMQQLITLTNNIDGILL